jgi:hypothetical protein
VGPDLVQSRLPPVTALQTTLALFPSHRCDDGPLSLDEDLYPSCNRCQLLLRRTHYRSHQIRLAASPPALTYPLRLCRRLTRSRRGLFPYAQVCLRNLPVVPDTHSGCSDVMSLIVALYAIKVRQNLSAFNEGRAKSISTSLQEKMPLLPIPTAGIVQKYLLHSSTPLSFSLFVSASSWRPLSDSSMCQVSLVRIGRVACSSAYL